MKKIFLSLVVVPLLMGCNSPTVALAPVGPNPNRTVTQASTGNLQIFSKVQEMKDDQNQADDGSPPWYQHTPYAIYDLDGTLVKRVENAPGHYAQDPALVPLAPGRYFVKAESQDYFWVNVPVTIEAGRTTRVHLDDKWYPPSDAAKGQVVTEPNGNPIGWRQNAITGN